jgi:ribosome biogenesis protein Nip4
MAASALAIFCEQFGSPVPDSVRVGRRWYADPHNLLGIAQQKGWDIFSCGIYLGEERGGFQPTSAMLDLLPKAPKIIVDEKSAWMVLCGKDVLMEGLQLAGKRERGDLVLITDMQGRVLGYGKVSVDAFNRKAKHRQYAKTLLDRGEYLRRER